jgi:DNA-binding NtrC family response regulator
MPRRILIIDDAHSPVEEWVGDPFGVGTATIIDRIGWCSAGPEQLDKWCANLILLVVGSAIAEVVRLLHCLGNKPNIAPTFAIIPDTVDHELLELASRAVDDFVIAPIRSHELHYRITRLLNEESGANTETLHERLAREIALTGLIGSDPAFLRMLRKLPLAASSNSPVLIVGETGTGKELCARAIHILSVRRNSAFIPVDCAALPEHLFENEMFGHARGAFTDARQDQKGLVEMAQGGTLFLDEVDSLSLAAQSKLLRFLQERTYRPLGSDRFFSADVKIVAASNRNLDELIRLKQLRSDLFFRLNVLRLEMLPLRERRSDIVPLANCFLEKLSADSRGVRKTFAPATLRRLAQHEWPGNVRELYNAVQRGFTFAEASEILPAHIFEEASSGTASTTTETFRQARLRAIESFERNYIADLLRESGGNITRAARIAKKDRRDFGRLVKRYQIKQ